MIPDIKPRPAIKPAGAQTADVIRRQILADFVALVGAHPELIASRPKCDAHGIADSPREDLSIRAVRIELEDARAVGFRSRVGNIRARTDGDVHLFAVWREDDIASPMSSAAQMCGATGKTCSQLFGWTARFEIAITIWKPDYAIGIRHIQELRIVAGWIKRDPEWFVQTAICKDFGDFRFSIGIDIAQHF